MHEAHSKTNFSDLNKNSFYKNNKVRQSFSFGGGYKSDYNSREFEILSNYKYKSKKFIHEFDFLHEVEEASTTKKELKKKEESYDAEFSSRMMLGETNNYINIYNRFLYDELSSYYYDISSAVGLGRLFFDGKIESSINIGHNEVKDSELETIVIAILRSNLRLSKIAKLSTRGLLTKAKDTYDEEIKNVLSFKMRKNLFLEFVHRYQKDRYQKTSKKLGTYRVNRVKREGYVRLKYNF